jgi:hypothetical protein
MSGRGAASAKAGGVMTSPTQRSLAALRKDGWLCQVVEHFNSFAKVRQDLFGFIDVLALRGNITLGVQTTDMTSVSKRLAKIRSSPHLAAVLAAGWRVEVHGWRKPTKTIRTWRQRVVQVLATDIPGNPVEDLLDGDVS